MPRSSIDAKSSTSTPAQPLGPTDRFPIRHLGPDTTEVTEMLGSLGCDSIDALIEQAIPASIRMAEPLALQDEVLFTSPSQQPLGEQGTLAVLQRLAKLNQVNRSYIGMGYHGTITPGVIRRTVFENPCWYTQYTPYQAEISQGRLEALLNFQTMVAELTGLPFANASLLDEATAAAEAMSMCVATTKRKTFFVSDDCHPQTIGVLETRAKGLGIELVVGTVREIDLEAREYSGVLVQYPATDGRVNDFADLPARVHGSGAKLVAAADPLSLTLLKPPGEWGADIAVGSTQRFGVPMGLGGPHAAYMAVREELVRKMPGRLIGVSRDNSGLRQPSAWPFRRANSTSNAIEPQATSVPPRFSSRSSLASTACITAPKASRESPSGFMPLPARSLRGFGGWDTWCTKARSSTPSGFDPAGGTESVLAKLAEKGINVRQFGDGSLGIALDETVDADDIREIWSCFGVTEFEIAQVLRGSRFRVPGSRTSQIVIHDAPGVPQPSHRD